MKRIFLIALMFLCGFRLQAQYNTGIGDGYAKDIITDFEIPITLTAPNLVAPINVAVGITVNPTLTWEALANATSYRVQISNNHNFTSLIVNELGVNTSKELKGLWSFTKYFWRVQAINEIENSDWSPTWCFTTTSGSNVEETNSNYFTISPQPVKNEAIVTYSVIPTKSVFGFSEANAGISSGISIELYDIKGTLVATYNFTTLSEGTNKLRFDVRNLISGMYNVIIKSGAEVYQAKMIKVD